jgi:beta-glucosidase
MNRRDFMRLSGLGLAGLAMYPKLSFGKEINDVFSARDFGPDFIWGVATAAAQIEGAWDFDGKGESIWDHFAHHGNHIADKSNGDISCNFYQKYPEDLALVQSMNFNAFRFSTSWSRVLPEGYGKANVKGIDFYNRIIDTCLEKGLQPWICLYHWDLPQALQEKGGWANREVLSWFGEYADLVSTKFGDRVKHWMVMNEPLTFVSLGYMTGYHAPGQMGFHHFFPAFLYAALCQADGARLIRSNCPNATIGSTYSCSWIDPVDNSAKNIKAARRLDALLNRSFVEPAMGLGFPTDELPFFKRLDKYKEPGDDERLLYDFDFIGIQNYFRVVGRKSLIPPLVWANQVSPEKRNVPLTQMGWEVYPEGIYKILKQFAKYGKPILVAENGASFVDVPENKQVHDTQRTEYFKEYLKQVLRAKQDGVPVTGYFVWTLVDNFEWAEGYQPRFGLVYNDFATQQRMIKDSGLWFKEFLKR